MAWEVSASDESGALVHLVQFHSKKNAQKHFLRCLIDYHSATPPYEINDDDVSFWEDE